MTVAENGIVWCKTATFVSVSQRRFVGLYQQCARSGFIYI